MSAILGVCIYLVEVPILDSTFINDPWVNGIVWNQENNWLPAYIIQNEVSVLLKCPYFKAV